MQNEIYLDNSATTAVADEVLQAMEPYWSVQFGNPSSPHLRGIAAEKTMSACRSQIASILQVHPGELFFTASGTEANNLAIQGVANAPYLLRNPGHLITTPIEHPSVLNVVKHLESRGWEVTYFPVDSHGRIDPLKLYGLIQPNTRLISVMAVNNELGTITPLNQVGKLIERENQTRQQKIIFHVDAVQALGHIPLSITASKAHLMTFSGHKIFGPKGIGLLYAQRQAHLRPIMFGGNQEGGLRPGTENIPGIVGITKAIQLVTDKFQENTAQMATLRKTLLAGVSSIPNSRINSPEDGAPHLLNVSFLGIRGEVLVHFLEQKRIFVSMGAACSSKRKGASHVLEAIGLPQEEILGAIRLSLGPQLTLDQIKYVVYSLKETVEEIRSIYM
jgi:cysteine desulfurase